LPRTRARTTSRRGELSDDSPWPEPQKILSWIGEIGSLEIQEVRPIRTGRTLIVLYRFRDRFGDRKSVVLRMGGKDTFPRTSRNHHLLAALLDGDGVEGWGREFVVPRPLVLLPDHRASLVEGFDGIHPVRLGSTRFDSESPSEELQSCRRTGEWLALFHQVASTIGEEWVELPGGSKTRDPVVLAKEIGEVRPDLVFVLASVLDWIRPHMGRKCQMIHGDFHPRNVLLSSRAVCGIDLERSRRGDPAEDLGSFWGRSRVMALFSGRDAIGLEPALQEFVRGYRDRAPHFGELVSRIFPYAALALLESAHFALFLGRDNPPDVRERCHSKPWREEFERLLEWPETGAFSRSFLR